MKIKGNAPINSIAFLVFILHFVSLFIVYALLHPTGSCQS